jgi:excisionase family DNA binding protein
VKAIAERLEICESIVYGWIADGELPHLRLGAKGHRGGIRVEEADLQAFLNSRKVGAGVAAPKPPPTRRPVKPKLKLSHVHLSPS